MQPRVTQDDPWSRRWSHLARAAGLSPNEPVALALSGGADSVFLLHVLARARPRPRVLAIHVDHRLRGEESEGDAAFCARLCARLSVPFARRHVELDPEGPNLEARAREARYRALAEEVRSAGLRTLVTGHHEDDALETLLLRWMRGSDLPGLPGLRSCNVLGAGEAAPVQVVRPLLSLRREEVRRLLRDAGHDWREDTSNADPRFTRNRVRGALLPEIERTCGPDGIEGLRAFAGAVERLEDELAGRTAHLSWRTPEHAPAVRSADHPQPGGTLERAPLRVLAAPLVRRALWRLLSEGTGYPPSRALIAELEQDLAADRLTRRTLPGGWTLQLRRDDILLSPPAERTAEAPARPRPREQRAAGTPEPAAEGSPAAAAAAEGLRLDVPGRAELPDGRVIEAALVELDPDSPVPTEATRADLDATGLGGPLLVRAPRAGDRFHPLGAPGSRPLGRFLRDAGVPAAERGAVPVVLFGDEIVWVAGLRPSEDRRVRPGTNLRLRLRLKNAAEVRRGSERGQGAGSPAS